MWELIATSGLVHIIVDSAVNVSDVTQAGALLHGDAGYEGVKKRKKNQGRPVIWHVATKQCKRKALQKNKVSRMFEKLEHLKANLRVNFEHSVHVIKNLFRR
ncbi:hypothetical protein GCM10009094_03720 [Massilia aurea]